MNREEIIKIKIEVTKILPEMFLDKCSLKNYIIASKIYNNHATAY